jgi:uncharacterized Zn-finger protein
MHFFCQIVHIREMPHPCALCDKKFALAESLKKHMRAVHLKSRGYPCAYCDYAASRADMLKIHVRKIHTKDWRYLCQYCENSGNAYSHSSTARPSTVWPNTILILLRYFSCWRKSKNVLFPLFLTFPSPFFLTFFLFPVSLVSSCHIPVVRL